VWTFDGTKTLRNGVWMGGGAGSEYLYFNGTVHVITTGGVFKWNDGWSYAAASVTAITGSSSGNTGTNTGSSGGSGTPQTSANGTRGKQVVDAAGAVWTLDGTKTLRNGVWVGGGNASEYLYVNASVYAVTTGGAFKWNDGWSFAGPDVAAILALASGTGSTSAASQPAAPTVKKPTVSMDFSGNGKSSVLWRNKSAGQNAIWSVDSASVTRTPIAGASAKWGVVGSADFNADAKADILWRDTEGNVAIWLMDGTNLMGGAIVANVPLTWTVAGVGDFNGDGKADVLWRTSTGTVALWLMDNFTITARIDVGTVSQAWTVVGVADLNNDGKADIVWRNLDGTVVNWLMNGATITQIVQTGLVSAAWSIVGVADFNGDGKADLLWRNATTGQNIVWHMDGGKQVGSGQFLPVMNDAKWIVVGTGDYNGDGKADILWRHSQSGGNALWTMNGAAATTLTLPAMTDPAWTVAKP
jgi:hypothetical protein